MSEREKNIIRSYTDLAQAERVVNLGFEPNKTCDMCFIDNGDGYINLRCTNIAMSRNFGKVEWSIAWLSFLVGQ